jgi:hypothetical protein
MVDNNSSLGED